MSSFCNFYMPHNHTGDTVLHARVCHSVSQFLNCQEFCGEVNASDDSREKFLSDRKVAEQKIIKGTLVLPDDPVPDVFVI